jgi:hypothetical protein
VETHTLEDFRQKVKNCENDCGHEHGNLEEVIDAN